jgi:stress-induced morphogen
MAKVARGRADAAVKMLLRALEEYERAFPGSEASIYRQNPGAIRIRIIDDGFAKMSRSRRHDTVWRFLTEHLPDHDVMGEVYTLLLVPKAELGSLANLEFEDPLPSRL